MHFKKSNDNQSTILHEGNVPYLTFRKLDQAGVRHGFSTRIGGVSEGMFATLNLSYNRCDKRKPWMKISGESGKQLDLIIQNLCFLIRSMRQKSIK